MERRNKKTKSVGNGEDTLYKSETLNCWIFQYYFNGSRKTMKQKKNETVKDFKSRVTKVKNELNTGTYIEKRKDTLKTIIQNHIEQKFNDGITIGSSYKRDKETLNQICICCSNFIDKPIQKITFQDIQEAKNKMKKYAQSGIDKMWRLLKKGFSIASSPSVGLIPFNIMCDENLKKPIPEKETKKIFPLTNSERKKLEYVLDNQERNHKYRNIVKLEWLTSMRIGEVCSRSKKDINKARTKLHIHNTLTKDKIRESCFR